MISSARRGLTLALRSAIIRAFTANSRFEIVRHIGSGGMGSVYEASDRQLGRRVALKRLDRGGPHPLLRFKREFRDFRDLSHPNLVEIQELFSDGAEWFFSMELLDGVDFLEYVRPCVDGDVKQVLASMPTATATATATRTTGNAPHTRLPRRTMPPRAMRGPLDEHRLRLALPQLALGIQALHDAGKLHRDIKPSNVLVTGEGRVVLIDYGLAVDQRDAPRADVLMGTVAYMAPEQAACRMPARAADWYAFGVVLYEALTGRRPHGGTTLEMIEAKRAGDAGSPRDAAPEAPRDLSALCEQLLKADPAARPSGSEVLARLGAIAASPLRRTPPVRSFDRTTPQLVALRTAYQQSRERARLVVVRGASGVGKTALVRRFIEELREYDPQVVALTASCSARESVPFNAFDGVFDALADYLESLPPESAMRLLPQDITLLADTFPVLWGIAPVQAAGPDEGHRALDPHEQRRRFVAAVRDLLARISEVAPLAIAVDGLDGADADSRALLAELLTGPGAPRMLVIATHTHERSQSVARLAEGQLLRHHSSSGRMTGSSSFLTGRVCSAM